VNNKILFISLFGVFITLYLVSTYLWMLGLSFVDLERPEFSSIDVETRDALDLFLRCTMLVGFWLPLLVVVIRRKWKPKVLILPTAISMILFVIMITSQDDYPEEYSEYTENGYQHRIEKWKEKDGTRVQHWKSQDSLKSYPTHRQIRWELVTKTEETTDQ